MAIIASKGPEEVVGAPEGERERDWRSVVEEPRRSPAEREEPVVEDWIWEAENSLEQAIGSSQDPGTDWTTMLDPLTPDARSLAFVPARRGSIMLVFQRACTIPMRRALPSCCWASPGPLSDAIIWTNCKILCFWDWCWGAKDCILVTTRSNN